MAERYKPLVLNVIHSDETRQFILGKGGKFTIGRNGHNDLILYGAEYPKKHTLIAQKNGAFHLNVKPFVNGEVSIDSSTLHIDELIKHDILPQHGDSYLLKLTPNKRGYVTVGDTKIEFSFKHIEPQKQLVARSPVYSWTRATLKTLGSDLLFKFTFLVLFLLNALVIYALKDYEVNIDDKNDMEKIPERLAKFIPKPPEELLAADSQALNINAEGEKGADKSKKTGKKSTGKKSGNTRKRSSGRGNPAAAKGLLGLIGGSGSNSRSSSIVDALVDKGIVADLEDILGGGTNLKVRKNGSKNGSDPLDQLIGTGGSGGIDDWLSSMEEDVPQVKLKKKAKVNLIKPKRMSGSTEALGYRSEQSILDVVLSRQGQIQYLYEKYLKRNPNLRGKVSIEFKIAANGFVIEARIIESTINQPRLERELLSLVKRLKFDPIPSGTVTTIFPFLFSKIN